MTIKEIEERSGISRANIRFYETEGLLHPKRRENGYRDYSETDVLILQRIKLLRSLGISLEMIRDISEGKLSLYRVLGDQIDVLNRMREETVRAESICRKMQQDMVTFDSLQPEKYEKISEEKEMPSHIYQETADVEPYIGPWRRYFARMLDLWIIEAVMETIFSVFLHVNSDNFSAIELMLCAIVAVIVMILLEPLILHLFGTTPGKCLLGLYLEEEDGRKPSISNAGCWTRGAVVRGMGLGVPILGLILQIVCFLRSYRREDLPWQYLVYRQKSGKTKRILCYICVVALLTLVYILNDRYVQMPPNRGELTVAEFAENYNRLHKTYGMDDELYLTENGKVEQRQDNADGGVVFEMSGQREYEVSYELDGEQIRGITVTETGKDVFMTQLYSDRMFLMMMSFAGAEKDMGIFYNRNKLAEQLERGIIDGQTQFSLGDTDFCYELDMNNMEQQGTMLFIGDDTREAEYTITYTMQKKLL